jgi:nucleoside-diphosphate-sugar epimerase
LRDFTDVEDAVNAFVMAAENPVTNGQVYNLGGSQVIDLAAVARLMVEVNGSGSFEVREFPADRQAIDIGDYYADFSKIRTQLGWEPKRALRDTIEATLSYFRASMPHYL